MILTCFYVSLNREVLENSDTPVTVTVLAIPKPFTNINKKEMSFKTFGDNDSKEHLRMFL